MTKKAKTSKKKTEKKDFGKAYFEYAYTSEAEKEELDELFEHGLTKKDFIKNCLQLLKSGLYIDLDGTYDNGKPVQKVVDDLILANQESVQNIPISDMHLHAINAYSGKILNAKHRGASQEVDQRLQERFEELSEAGASITASAMSNTRGKKVNYNTAKRWLEKNHPELFQ